MDPEKRPDIRRDLAASLTIVAAIALVLLSIAATVAECAVGRLEKPLWQRADQVNFENQEVVRERCPESLEAFSAFFSDPTVFAREYPTLYVGEACGRRSGQVLIILRDCAKGKLSDRAAANLIWSLSANCRKDRKVISL